MVVMVNSFSSVSIGCFMGFFFGVFVEIGC